MSIPVDVFVNLIGLSAQLPSGENVKSALGSSSRARAENGLLSLSRINLPANKSKEITKKTENTMIEAINFLKISIERIKILNKILGNI
jgi:hypothetical protein